jgi:hypothetical protein
MQYLWKGEAVFVIVWSSQTNENFVRYIPTEYSVLIKKKATDYPIWLILIFENHQW